MMLFKRAGSSKRSEMSLIEHLEAFRGHLFKSAIAIALGAIIMAVYNNFIVKTILLGPTHGDFPSYGILCRLSKFLKLGNRLCLSQVDIKMQSTVVGGQFGVYFNIILIGGFILAFPYVFWQFWKFAKPALTKRELHNTRGVIFWVSLLFFTGVLFGYYVIAPYTINFFANFSLDDNILNLWTISSYFSALTPIILGSGLAFQLPLVMFFLAKVDVVSAAFLRKGRKYAIVIMLIVTGIITPPDMLSQVICTIPLIILYEISIRLCLGVEKKKKLGELHELQKARQFVRRS